MGQMRVLRRPWIVRRSRKCYVNRNIKERYRPQLQHSSAPTVFEVDVAVEKCHWSVPIIGFSVVGRAIHQVFFLSF